MTYLANGEYPVIGLNRYCLSMNCFNEVDLVTHWEAKYFQLKRLKPWRKLILLHNIIPIIIAKNAN